eukprot:9193287-Karenia_brevis.AAC.1
MLSSVAKSRRRHAQDHLHVVGCNYVAFQNQARSAWLYLEVGLPVCFHSQAPLPSQPGRLIPRKPWGLQASGGPCSGSARDQFLSRPAWLYQEDGLTVCSLTQRQLPKSTKQSRATRALGK